MKPSCEAVESLSPSQLRRRPLGRYRYVRLRWRLVFAVIDGLGGVLFGLARWLRRAWPGRRQCDSTPDPRRILLVQLDHLGDAVITTAILPALRRRWPNASLEVLASRSNRELFATMDEVDWIHVCDANRFARTGWGRWTWGLAILWWGRFFRRRPVDLAIDVRGDFPIALLMWLSGARRRLGWACGGGGFLLTDQAPFVPGRAEVASRWALLEQLGIKSMPGEPTHPRVCPSEDARRAVATALDQASDDAEDERPLVAVHMGAGTPAKQWPLEYWVCFVRWLHTQAHARVVLVGSSEDRGGGATIAACCGDVLDWTGRWGIEELAALLNRADLLVGADSGPAHLAAAVGTSAVVLFSGTNDPAQWRPRGAEIHVLRAPVPCSPCHREVCPRPGHPCMRRLSPQAVAEFVQWRLPPAEQTRRSTGVAS